MWKEGRLNLITAGIDCGAKTTKTVIMQDGKIVGRAAVLTGFDQAAAITESLSDALRDAGISVNRLDRIAGTGSGAKSIQDADLLVNEIKAIAAAANYFFPSAGTVVDVGAEESRAVKCDDKGRVIDFVVNEKCAAGAGIFIEAMARALEIEVEKMGETALSSENSIRINAQCTIFAESEVVGLIHANTEKKDICKAIHDAMASRIGSMIRHIGMNPDVVMLGGTAYNRGFVAAMKRELDVDLILVPDLPEFGAAVGASIAAGRADSGNPGKTA